MSVSATSDIAEIPQTDEMIIVNEIAEIARQFLHRPRAPRIPRGDDEVNGT